MKKIIYTVGMALLFPLYSEAQEAISGIIKDVSGKPMSGVFINKVGEMRNNVVTDVNGVFSLDLENGDYIDVNYADKVIKRVKVTGDGLDIVLDADKDAAIDMGFLKRTSENSTQSVSYIGAEQFQKSSTSMTNIKNSFYGLLSGLHASQNNGWNAASTLRVRGQGGLSGAAPIILIDGFRRALDHSILEEIESVHVLKDGAATALYGARGANGVILVNTKRGEYNSFDIDVNYRHGFSKPINQPEMADAYTYAKAQNEALYYDGLPLQYTQEQLESIKNGTNPMLYPNVNWIDEATRTLSESNQFNLALRGGGKKVRYLALLDYKNEFGLINKKYTDLSNRYSAQIRDYELELRMNLDVDVTSSTKFRFDMFGTLTEHKRPNKGIDDIYSSLYQVPALAFPIKTANDNWGSNSLFNSNPIATFADKGYVQENRRLLYADMRLTQDFSMFLKGLNAEVAIGYDNSAVFRDVFSKNYMYEFVYLGNDGSPISETHGENTTLQRTSSGLSSQILRTTVEAKLNYDRTFGNHNVMASAVYRQESEVGMAVNSSHYRQNVMGFVGYNYDNRYMVDVVANYFGTSVLLKGDKFRFYPAVSAGWNLANEQFLKDASFVDLLKVRASWGRSAIDNLDYGLGSYFWVGGSGYSFGENNASVGGIKEGTLPIRQLELETADKYNWGVDLRLWKTFTATAEVYYDHRKNILRSNNHVSGMMGLDPASANIGEVKSKGFELGLGWNDRFKDFKYYANANIAFNGSEVIEDGQAFQLYDYLYTKGHKVGQLFGLEAIGYFSDEDDIQNSPVQSFSTVRPGDIKYKDQNGDRVIDNEDKVAIGKSTTTPDMVYGLNLGFEYKGFGVDMVFNGVAGITKLLNVANVHQPLRNGKSNISTWYLKDRIRWTEKTKDIANLPRLSTLSNDNNYQTSTQWMEDGSFFKMRNLNLYYNLPEKWVRKVKMDKCQIYVRAENLFSLDKVKDFNCEDLSLGYPDLFNVYLGFNINF